MSSLDEIELAIRELPNKEKYSLVLKLHDMYWSAWDEQIESDYESGMLDTLLAEVNADIDAGNTKKLDDILRDS